MENTLQPQYIERLKRLQDVENEASGGATSSVEGLIEQAVSTYLYEREAALDITPRQLPVVEIDGKRYYQDDRLAEYRSVENPHDRIVY